jgi:Ca2+-binding RTX toxin-like protein
MTSLDRLTLAAATAQAAYGDFSASVTSAELNELRADGEFTLQAGARFIGSIPDKSKPFNLGVVRVAYLPDQLNGFSATVFRDNATQQAILAIRGSNGISDFIQDAKIGVIGFASDQLISLYRYYRCLTSPAGQAVTYSDSEKDLLHRLNTPLSLPSPFNSLTNLALDAQLAFDKGMGVLQPGEQLVVTGHSLGGHLALLFGRVFPSVTDAVYTFNAPGILPWGDWFLTAAGVGPNDASRVTNVISANGIDATAAIGSKPGETIRIHNEATSDPVHNHSVARQSEALALYDLFGALSPTLGLRVNDISAILEASSSKPTETLESALDMLGLVLGEEFSTDIAVGTSDSAAREEYFSNLYSLRDQNSGGGDWQIYSLAGLTASQLAGISSRAAVRYALSELMPFAVLEGSFDESPQDLSQQWLLARAEFLAELTEVRTADAIFGQSGSQKNFTFFDVDRDVRVSLLSAGTTGQALSQGAEQDIRAFLAGFAYDRLTAFGSDHVENPDSLAGSSGGDRLFGGAGNDTLSGLDGDDLIEDGAGTDFLIGGMGADTYLLATDADIDRIRDTDGRGSIRMDGGLLTGAFERAEGVFVSYDGKHDYTFAGDLRARGTLTVDASLVIEEFLNGDFGIYLSGVPDASAASPAFTYHGDREGAPGDGPDEFDNWILTGPEYAEHFDVFKYGRPGNTGFETGGGNDYAIDIYGGNDLFRLGGGEDYADGGDGDDSLEGGSHDDLLIGGGGNDYIVTGTIGEDIEALSPPNPTYLGVINMNLATGGGGEDTVVGSAYSEYLEGGASADVLHGGAGNDVITGDGYLFVALETEPLHPDYMWPGSGYHSGGVSSLQRVAGYIDSPGAGADTIFAGSGNDQVDGGGGADMLFGGPGHDLLMGGVGNDELHADLGVDTIHGGDGDDLILGGTGGGQLNGDAGNDTLVGASTATQLRGGSGVDVYEGSFLGYMGDGDIVRMTFGQGHSAFLFAEGSPPAGVTVEFGPDVLPDDLITRQTASGGWTLGSMTGTGTVTFFGDDSQWSGLSVTFADGTVWQHSDFTAHADTSPPAPPFQFPPLPGSGEAGGEGGEGGGPAPNPSDNLYYVGDAGRQTISDYAGTDRVTFAAHGSDDVSVFSAGSDLLLRYEGGEVRLAGQVDAADGIEAVSFAGDGVTWDRATLASNAIELPESQSSPLGIEVVAPGAAFSFTIGEEVFANEYAIGDTRLEATDLQGGALPTWLTFDAEQGTFSGTPAAADAGVTAVLVALRDESGVVAVAPLVIAVDAGEETGGGGGGGEEQPPPAAPPSVPVSEDPPPTRTVLTQSDFIDLPAVLPAPFASVDTVPLVGAIDDPVYRSIERLLSAPATLHAPVFLERYAEAVQEFRERHPAPEEAPEDPLPTDDEMAGYNASLHAWLDADQRRLAAAAHDGGWDFGGMEMNWVHPGSGIDRLLGGGGDAFARPGLPALPVIHQQPGLKEGLAALGP